MTTKELAFTHRYVETETANAPTLLLLHGTGGDEDDLLPLGHTLAAGADVNILSPRGQISERGMPRFFRRLAEGVFDEEDVVRRAHELADFVSQAGTLYGFDTKAVIAVGYSNGANIAAAMMLLRPEILRAAALFHAQPVMSDEGESSGASRLDGKRIFLSGGRADPVVPAAETTRLAEILRRAGAEVTLAWQPGGHALTAAEVGEARDWLRPLL